MSAIEIEGYKERKFYGEFVGVLVKAVYGRSPSSDTWKRWREWAGIAKRRKEYSWEQLCFMVAIAAVRKDSPRNYPEMDARRIQELANSLELQERVALAVAEKDKHGIIGREIIPHYRSLGLKIQRSRLYRAIPDFSTSHLYTLDVVKIALGY